jgi:hypothetical protein
MLARLRSHLTYANVVSTIALCLVVGGGSALAANTIFSVDIVDGEVRNADLGANAVGSAKIADRAVKNADLGLGASSSNTIADAGIQGVDVKGGTLTGAHLTDDSLTGADIDESTLARPIYAKVEATSGDVVFEESWGIGNDNVYKPTGTTGTYCFTNLPFRPETGLANPISAAIAASVIVAPSGWPGDCAMGDVAEVQLRRTDNQELIDQYFTVWFTATSPPPGPE